MTNIRPQPFVKIKTVVCTLNLFENEEFLRLKYCQEKLSARQIAVLIGCSHSTVNDALKELGIDREKRQTGKIPYGDRLKDGMRIPHVREQKVIKSIAAKSAKGWSGVMIADWLNNNRISSPSGGQWYSNTVLRVLRD